MDKAAKQLKRGRPRKEGASEIRRQVRFPRELLTRVEAAAREAGVSVDGWVRDACAQKLRG